MHLFDIGGHTFFGYDDQGLGFRRLRLIEIRNNPNLSGKYLLSRLQEMSLPNHILRGQI